MLSLNRPHRQALATLALVVLTIFPTGYVAFTAWRINRPKYARELEGELSRRLGLQVALEQVRHPKPGEDVLRGVTLRVEEAKGKASTALARSSLVHIRRGARDLALEVEGLRLAGEGPRQAMAQVAALLQRAGGSAYERASLSARHCHLELDGGPGPRRLSYRLRDVVGMFRQAGPAAPTITISYRVPSELDDEDDGGHSTTRCELSLTRSRQGSAMQTVLVFKTMEGPPLPARVLDPFFDAGAWLGRPARVEGTLTLRQRGSADWEAEFQGNLIDVDLAALVGQRFPDHRLTGLARVKVASARWADRPGGQGFGWVEADGELSAGPGTIGMSLVRALKAEMKFRVPGPLEAREADLAYHGLGLSFAMTRDGQLRLGGGLGAEFPPEAVLVDAGRLTPLAWAPAGTANVRGLIRTLFPSPAVDPTVLVPATAESQALQRYLPVPPAIAQKSSPIAN